jgi:hypothetical protein
MRKHYGSSYYYVQVKIINLPKIRFELIDRSGYQDIRYEGTTIQEKKRETPISKVCEDVPCEGMMI